MNELTHASTHVIARDEFDSENLDFYWVAKIKSKRKTYHWLKTTKLFMAVCETLRVNWTGCCSCWRCLKSWIRKCSTKAKLLDSAHIPAQHQVYAIVAHISHDHLF